MQEYEVQISGRWKQVARIDTNLIALRETGLYNNGQTIAGQIGQLLSDLCCAPIRHRDAQKYRTDENADWRIEEAIY